jgi:superfamily II DNA/RNA helicase
MLLSSEPGSGKTLAYLLPIMNSLYNKKDEEGKGKNSARIKITKENEELMYQDA